MDLKIINNIKSYFDRLDEKERLILVGSVVGGIFLICIITLVVIYGMITKIEKQIKNNEKILSEMIDNREQFISTNMKLSNLKKLLHNETDQSLTTLLEEYCKQLNINIDSIKPVSGNPNDYLLENVVEVRIDQVKLNDLVELFYKIETYKKIIKINSIDIKPKYADPINLKVTFNVSSFMEKG